MSGLMKRLEDQVFRNAAPLAIRHLSLPDLDTHDPVARPDQSITDALAHFAMTAEMAGENAIAAPVRELVQANLNRWQGEDPPLSRAWLEDAVTPLDDTLRNPPPALPCWLPAHPGRWMTR